MTQTQRNIDSLQVALFTVQVEREIAEAIQRGAAAMPWALIPVAFDTYFSPAKRPHLTKQAIGAGACLAVIDFDKDPALAVESAGFLRQSFYQKIAIVGISSQMDPDLLLQAMRAGCTEFLRKPFDPDQWNDALGRLDQRWSTNLNRPQNSGKILSFFGAKGGVGATTLAVHLAMFLVGLCKKKVLLIDNHAQLGHVCLYLGLDGNRYHFNELIRNVNRLDHELLRGFIATHPSGLDVLSSPDVHGGPRSTDAASVERTLGFLATVYDYVLLDCEASFEDVNLTVVDISNTVYLISTAEIGAIRDLSRYVDGLIQNEQATDKLQVVINRFSARDAVSIEQIEKAIRLPVAVKVSNNYSELVRSINTGEPLPADRKTDFSQEVVQWATALAGVNGDAPSPAKRRFALWK